MSACARPIASCPECGDSLIHQTNRGPHESSSAFGQYIHDRGEYDRGEWARMFWMDIDGAIFKQRTGVLRIIEHKPVGGGLSSGQKEVLPLLAKALQLLAATGLVHPQSGVFVIHSDHPHDRALIAQISGWKFVKVSSEFELAGDLLDSFLRGEEMDPRQALGTTRRAA